MNVYLFEKNVSALTIQKHNRELEMIVQECILAAIRESIPTEAIIRAYLEEAESIVDPDNLKVPKGMDEDKREDMKNKLKDN